MFTRKEIFNLGLIAILIVAIPAAVFFLNQQQILKSKAAPGAVIFTGPNVQTVGNKTIASSENIQIQVKSPFEATNPAPTPTPGQNNFTPTDPPTDLQVSSATMAGPSVIKVGQTVTYNMKNFVSGGKGVVEFDLAEDQGAINGKLQSDEISGYDIKNFNCAPRVDPTGNCAWYRLGVQTYTDATEKVNSTSTTITFTKAGNYVLAVTVVPDGRHDLACSNNPYFASWPVKSGDFTFWQCSGLALKIKVNP